MKTLVITKPNGNPVTITEYVRSWRTLLTLPPSALVKGWCWFPTRVEDVLRDIRTGIHDRINQHLPWTIADMELDRMRVRRKLSKLVRIGLLKCECRWCGSPLRDYQHHENRFCDQACRRSYY